MYTHYWSQKNLVITDDAIKDIEAILKEAKNRSIAIASGAGYAAPIVTKELISINGFGDQGYESFFVEPDGCDFNFTKTNRMPYDSVVCAILLRLNEDADIEVDTDGSWNAEWQEARDLFAETLGREAERPTKVRLNPPSYTPPQLSAVNPAGSKKNKTPCGTFMPRARRSCSLTLNHAGAHR